MELWISLVLLVFASQVESIRNTKRYDDDDDTAAQLKRITGLLLRQQEIMLQIMKRLDNAHMETYDSGQPQDLNILRQFEESNKKTDVVFGIPDSFEQDAFDEVGFWPLTEKLKGVDISDNGNDIKFHNVLYEEACDSCEKVVSLLGKTSSYGEILGDMALDVQKSFTWMASLNLFALEDGPLFEWSDDTAPHGFGGRIWIFEGNFHFGPNDYLPNVNILALNSTMLRRWVKIAISWDFETGTVKTYFDGHRRTMMIHGEKRFVHAKLQNIRIGVRKPGLDHDHSALNGMMSCMKLFRGVLDVNLVEYPDTRCAKLE